MHAFAYYRPRGAVVAVVVLTMVLLGVVTLVPTTAAEASVPAARPTATPTPTIRPNEPAARTAQDRLITVAAIGSIVLVAVAGTYIYVLIRRGL